MTAAAAAAGQSSAFEGLSSDGSDVEEEEVAKAKLQADYYDETLDDKDEAWTVQRRRGRKSDAILSCPACFTSLCIDCQRHERYVHQYRAMFVHNCRTVENEVLRLPANPQGRKFQKRKKKAVADTVDPSSDRVTAETGNGTPEGEEVFKPVRCSVCDTEVAVMDKDEVYHFFNVMPSYS